MKDFNIGDRVIVKSSFTDEIKGKGIISRNGRGVEIKNAFMVKYDEVLLELDGHLSCGYHNINYLELDVQYYREERLKQLLDN